MSSGGCGRSIVDYRSDGGGSSCGYCHSKTTCFSNGMWAHTMTVEDYQDLIDRGWRRSGQYCYKPIMTLTCCPMYTIKCAVQDFRVSKSQKKILKRFHNFLAYGVVDKNVKPSSLSRTEVMHSLDVPEMEHSFDLQNKKLDAVVATQDRLEAGDMKLVNESESQNVKKPEVAVKDNVCDMKVVEQDQSKGAKVHCMKAKYLRMERKRQKLRNMGLSEKEVEERMLARKRKVTVKSLEDFLNVPQPENPAHKLEIRLVSSFPAGPGFEDTYEVFRRYQTHVHGDAPEKISRSRFQRFLVNSPLEIRLVLVKSPEFANTFAESASLFAKYQKTVHKESDEDCGSCVFNYFLVSSPLEPKKCYGSYHQQYWLDGKLIAVGVIDILPKCLSSVYFLYDPDYMWLSLGTYGALREVEFVRKLTSQYPDIKYYYMGFYIHSCVKMRYKAAFRPSYLLCPEAYTWHPIQSCLPKLDASKYARLNEDPSAKDPDSNISISDVAILYSQTVMSFGSYSKLVMCSSEERNEVLLYATLVGMQCARRILLYR